MDPTNPDFAQGSWYRLPLNAGGEQIGEYVRTEGDVFVFKNKHGNELRLTRSEIAIDAVVETEALAGT